MHQLLKLVSSIFAGTYSFEGGKLRKVFEGCDFGQVERKHFKVFKLLDEFFVLHRESFYLRFIKDQIVELHSELNVSQSQ